jgi:hypothetical protein
MSQTREHVADVYSVADGGLGHEASYLGYIQPGICLGDRIERHLSPLVPGKVVPGLNDRRQSGLNLAGESHHFYEHIKGRPESELPSGRGSP